MNHSCQRAVLHSKKRLAEDLSSTLMSARPPYHICFSEQVNNDPDLGLCVHKCKYHLHTAARRLSLWCPWLQRITHFLLDIYGKQWERLWKAWVRTFAKSGWARKQQCCCDSIPKWPSMILRHFKDLYNNKNTITCKFPPSYIPTQRGHVLLFNNDIVNATCALSDLLNKTSGAFICSLRRSPHSHG